MNRLEQNAFLCALVFVIFVVTSSCGLKFTLKPHPSRMPIIVSQLVAQSSDYQFLDIPIDSMITTLLTDDFIEIEEINQHYGRILTAWQNPFRPVHRGDIFENCFVISGVVERVAYEPIIEVKKHILNYALWGLLGLAHSRNTDDMAVHVQYRFHIKDTIGNSIGSFVAVGTSSGDPVQFSRHKLTYEANVLAAYHLASLLISILRDNNISIEGQEIHYDAPWERRWRYLNHMNNLIAQAAKPSS